MREWLGLGGLRCTFTLTLVMLGTITWLGPFSARAAPTVTPWLDGAAPNLDVFPGEQPALRFNYNLDCAPERGITRHAGLQLANPLAVTRRTIQGCAIYAPYGKFIGNHLRLNNTSLYGHLNKRTVPVTGSATVLQEHVSVGAHTSGSAYLLPDYPSLLHPARDDLGLYYLQDPGDPVYLKYPDGNFLGIDYDSISFSSNGAWMVGIADQRLFRVNLNTYEIFMFGEARFATVNTQGQTAISDDGHYLAFASSSRDEFLVYDLGDCQAGQAYPSCQHRDLLPFVPAYGSGGAEHLALRFLPGGGLSFYRHDYNPEGDSWSRMVLGVGRPPLPVLDYLALGDSFASGEGAYAYLPGTDTAGNNCHLSARSYPFLLGSALGLGKTESVACSGALLADITNTSPGYSGQAGGNLPISTVLSQFLPGYLPQASFLDSYAAQAITVSIGGNNIGFGKKILRCVEADTCYATYEDRLEIVREINSKFDALVRTYGTLRSQSPPEAGIYVVGYPELAKPGGDCALNVRLNASEVELSNQLVSYLNFVIERAATKAGVLYVDAASAFRGHRLCEAAKDQTAVNGVTVGNDLIDWGIVSGPIGNESYHPNGLGHRLLKDRVLQATANLTALAPAPDLLAEDLDEDSSLELLDAPKTGRPVYQLNYDDDLANNVVVREAWWSVAIGAGKALLRAFSPVKLVLHSDPVLLGDFTAAGNGGFAADVQIPASVPPGYHTLHLYGENLAGEPIDIQKVIYVAAHADDFDGDDIANAADTCLDIAQSDDEGICEEAEPSPVLTDGDPDDQGTFTPSGDVLLVDDVPSGGIGARVAAIKHRDLSALSVLGGIGGIALIRRTKRRVYSL